MIVKPNLKNLNLEILRGYAALIVIIHHVIFHNKRFDSNFFPKSLLIIEPPGHFAVLIFFMLSGYVMGSVYKNRLEGASILTYIRKRIIRIYPIYFIAMILTLAVVGSSYSIPTVISNFTITQNILYSPMIENGPAWSLNYEMLFYFIFIAVSFFRVNSLLAFFSFLIIGISNLHFQFNALLSSYCFGYCFWLCGLYMAQQLPNVTKPIKILPLLLYIVAIQRIINESILLKYYVFDREPFFKVSHFFSQNIISISDLVYLPYCFMIVMFLALRDFKYSKFFFLILQLLPLASIYFNIRHHSTSSLFLFGVALYFISLIIYFINFKEELIKRIGLTLGAMSYGIYIVHFPILCLFGKFVLSHDNIWMYGVRFILYISVTLFIGWALEQKFQPWISKKLSSNPR